MIVVLLASSLLSGSAACAWLDRGEPWVSAGPLPVNWLAGWQHETAGGLRQALLAQCDSPQQLTARWTGLCRELADLPPADAGATAADPPVRAWVESRFDAWVLTSPNGGSTGLLTGYYEPVVRGSRVRLNDRQVPLYAPPSGWSGERFADRAAIVAGHQESLLAGRELLWIDDPVDAFFLQIQGSGRVILPDGQVVRVGFAAHNGHDYVAIGKVLVERGAIHRRDLSAQAIRRWLQDHPDQAQAVMNLNPRYVFFRLMDGDAVNQGPIGSLGVPLTPHRSVAADRRYLPPGALVYLHSRPALAASAPDGQVGRATPFGLALNQDSGGAIRGAVRADLYTGTGEAAGELAGQLRERLQMWLLWPKGAMPPGKIPFARPDGDD